jgi:hypothetical protein
MPTANWTAYAAADTAVASADLNALASGTAAANFRLGAAIDNSSSGYLYGDLEIVIRDATPADSTITTGTGSPFLDVYIIRNLDDGTRYGTTNGGSTAGPTAAQYLAGSVVLPASTAVGVIIVPGLILPPAHFKIMINNQLGVTFPSNNNCLCRLYRYGEEA